MKLEDLVLGAIYAFQAGVAREDIIASVRLLEAEGNTPEQITAFLKACRIAEMEKLGAVVPLNSVTPK